MSVIKLQVIEVTGEEDEGWDERDWGDDDGGPLEPEDHFIEHVTDNDERPGGNAFLTGAGGTGKTYTLHRLIENSQTSIDVTAPTGVAALNVGGMTIHRFCGMLIGPDKTKTNEQFHEDLKDHPYHPLTKAIKRIQNCECLVIDEISMMPGRQLDFVNYLFKYYRGCSAAFGGCQVIATGDFLQLPPVRKDNQPYDWAFDSEAWKEANFKTFLLEKIRRQDDPDFVRALCELRLGKMSHAGAKLLADRVTIHPDPKILRLFTHNAAVEKWNNLMLDELPGDPTVFWASTDGLESEVDFLIKNLLTPQELRLKVGAQVIFTMNKYEYVLTENGNLRSTGHTLYVNGESGIVRHISPNLIEVEKESGYMVGVERNTWHFNQMKMTGATFTQFPLRLSYALSIHKAQGLTLKNAYVDIRAAREPGQAYTACSRVSTLAGLHFKEWPKICFTSNRAVEFYEKGLIKTVPIDQKILLPPKPGPIQLLDDNNPF